MRQTVTNMIGTLPPQFFSVTVTTVSDLSILKIQFGGILLSWNEQDRRCFFSRASDIGNNLLCFRLLKTWHSWCTVSWWLDICLGMLNTGWNCNRAWNKLLFLNHKRKMWVLSACFLHNWLFLRLGIECMFSIELKFWRKEFCLLIIEFIRKSNTWRFCLLFSYRLWQWLPQTAYVHCRLCQIPNSLIRKDESYWCTVVQIMHIVIQLRRLEVKVIWIKLLIGNTVLYITLTLRFLIWNFTLKLLVIPYLEAVVLL